jgi:hypothetical protein
MRRNTEQLGWIEQKQRAQDAVYIWRCRPKQPDGNGKKKSVVLGTVQDIGSRENAWKRAKTHSDYVHLERSSYEPNSFGARVQSSRTTFAPRDESSGWEISAGIPLDTLTALGWIQ